jgi:hypothetical protein
VTRNCVTARSKSRLFTLNKSNDDSKWCLVFDREFKSRKRTLVMMLVLKLALHARSDVYWSDTRLMRLARKV